jgi:hypothetical protein
MLEARSISLIIFTALNALGIGFLLYVLVQFWKEGHKSTGVNHLGSHLSGYGAGPRVFAVTAPVTPESRREDGRVIRFPVRGMSEQQRCDETIKHAIR